MSRSSFSSQATRRSFLQSATAATAGGWFAAGGPVSWSWGHLQENRRVYQNGELKLSTFRVDVTPPVGHSCCGGWIEPVKAVTEPLLALGVAIQGLELPVVICAVDWTGILNGTHLLWRELIAKAVGTQPEYVAVQCVHQHNAPFACVEAQEVVSAHPELPSIVDADFVQDAGQRVAEAARRSLQQSVPLTHVGLSHAPVRQVASNRRIVNAAGELVDWRGSRRSRPEHARYPEGLIDPHLRTVSLENEEGPVAMLHYYATHPMSFYGDGVVTSDFVGIARERLQAEHPEVLQVYLTGCAGNVAAGKYNDGSPEAREQLADRVYDALTRSVAERQRYPLEQARWRHRPLIPEPRANLDETALLQQIADPSRRTVDRNRSAFQVAWLRRLARQQPIVLSALQLGPASLLHLPAESFIEYQLTAQRLGENQFVATAAYGDGGPWYIPTQEAYPQGGYEVSVAFSQPSIDELLVDGIASLLDSA